MLLLINWREIEMSWEVLENQLKGTNKLWSMNKFQNAVNHSRGLAQRASL